MSKILVTGGLGLIGHNVVATLERMGHTVTVTDIKTNYGIIPKEELEYLMSERLKKLRTVPYEVDISYPGIEWVILNNKPDIVMHLASFPRQKVVNIKPQLGSRTMSEGLLNLLEASVRGGVKRFMYVSSSMVYGDFTDDVIETTPCAPQGQYGIMKYAGELLVKDYTRKHGMAHTIIRPSAVYGPLDVEDRVIAKFMLQAMRGQTLKVNGANEALDFTYSTDAADGMVAAALSPNTVNKTYNITKSHSRTLLDAAQLAVKIVGKGSIEVRNKDADFPSRGALNIDSARKDFGFDPKIDVEEGFQKYYEWLSGSEYYKVHLLK